MHNENGPNVYIKAKTIKWILNEKKYSKSNFIIVDALFKLQVEQH